MPIFSKVTRITEGNSIFIGAYLPLTLNSYFTLFSLAMENPKATILCDLVREWQDEMQVTKPKDELIKILQQKAISQLQKARKKKGFSFPVFLSQIHIELKKKGVDSSDIKLITKDIKEDGAF